jgi:hypothetical protein
VNVCTSGGDEPIGFNGRKLHMQDDAHSHSASHGRRVVIGGNLRNVLEVHPERRA